jgi:hypothetical protein
MEEEKITTFVLLVVYNVVYGALYFRTEEVFEKGYGALP